MSTRAQAPQFLDGLYGEFVEYGIRNFFPSAGLEAITNGSHQGKQRITENPDGPSLTLAWLGAQYVFDNGKPFSDSELKLLKTLCRGHVCMILTFQRGNENYCQWGTGIEGKPVRAIVRDTAAAKTWVGSRCGDRGR